jgi:hypothetical protein
MWNLALTISLDAWVKSRVCRGFLQASAEKNVDSLGHYLP